MYITSIFHNMLWGCWYIYTMRHYGVVKINKYIFIIFLLLLLLLRCDQFDDGRNDFTSVFVVQ